MPKFVLLSVVFLLVALSACTKDDDTPSQPEWEQIRDHLQENNLITDTLSSGLQYIIEEPGNSVHPEPTSTVKVNYVGKLLDGSVFDESATNTPARFNLQNVILGWQQGIPLFGIGGKGTLIVPSNLGYGAQARSVIPPNSVLVFDVELVGIE